MSRNLKVLGMALVVFVAVGNATIAPASAKIVHDFHSEAGPFILTGEQLSADPIKFEIGEGLSLECSAQMLNGTIESSTPLGITVEPTHEECTSGGVPAVVDNEGCRYVFTGETDAFGHAKVHVECEGKSKIRLTVTGCTVEIGEQTPSGGAHYTNTGSGKSREVDAKVTTTNLKYSLVGVLCGAIGGTGADLSVRGTYTLAAYKDNSGKEGERVGFWTEETVLP